MELQGQKGKTHDFLSLYKDPSFPHHQESWPPSQAFFLTTHDFLQPLERLGKSGSGAGEATASASAAAPAIDINVSASAAAATTEKPASVEHVLPGGFGTYTISHVPGYTPPPPRSPVKPEWATCSSSPPPRGSSAAERKAESNGGGTGAGVAVCSNANSSNSSSYNSAGAFPNNDRGATSRGRPYHQHQHQWPSPLAGRANANGSSVASIFSSRNHQAAQDRRRSMDTASKSSRRFSADDDDNDEEEFGKIEGSSSIKELTVRLDGGKSNIDQKGITPRSKHSATEQRRRSKINDRFQILRDLIPNNNQKRDKATFLLEVIEYIQFLQEKVQKYEPSYPGQNHENTKLMPWKNSQGPGGSIADPSQVIRNGSAPPAVVFSGNTTIPGSPTLQPSAQNVAESENTTSALASKSAAVPLPSQYASIGLGSGFSQPQHILKSDSENMASQPQAQWLRSCTTDCSISSGMLNRQEELTIDEGTISLSSVYSQGILTTLARALNSSGIDLSQASISVQINLGKRAISRPTSSAKDREGPISSTRAVGHSRVGDNGEESEQANKRHKSDTS